MKILSIFAFLLSFTSLQAQQVWSLEDCIDYALKNNISLKQAELNIRIKESQLVQSKLQVLPSLNAASSFNKNKGRFIDPFSNDFVEEVSSFLNLSYSANTTIFNGFKNYNQIKKAANESLKSIYDLETSKNELISTLALSYLQILFNEELYNIASKQLELTKGQEERINTLVEAGSLAQGELLNIQSQFALEEQQLIQAENQLNLSKLQLAQILELDKHQNLQVLSLDLLLNDFQLKENINDDFALALKKQSSIKSADLQVKSAEYDLKIARANYYPNFSLGYLNSTLYSDNLADMMSFNDQLDNNQQAGITLSLSIPIFNQWMTRTAVNQSKIQIENSILNAKLAKNQLRKNMEQAYTDQLAAYKRHQAALKAEVANKASFGYISDRYELGMVNSYEFNESKNKLIKAESDELQAKYDLIFKVKLYDFYTSLTFEL